jgi:hypothetical protein
MHAFRSARIRSLLLAAALLAGAAAGAQGWQVFRSEKFGFAMLVSPGTQWAARSFGSWGGIAAETGFVKFFALVSVGEWAGAEQLEKAIVGLTKLPPLAWSMVDRHENHRAGTSLYRNGWRKWRTYLAKDGRGGMLYAVMGHGQRGSYLLFLETTEGDYAAHETLYQQWYATLTVF